MLLLLELRTALQHQLESAGFEVTHRYNKLC
jgi:hypothetical protein